MAYSVILIHILLAKVENFTLALEMKAARSGKMLFLTSLRHVDDAKCEITRLKRKKGAKVIKD